MFTVNNPADWKPELSSHVTYLVWQLEKGASGTLHFQGTFRRTYSLGSTYTLSGYLELDKKKGLTFLKTAFHPTAHYEGRRGTQAQAVRYCRKADTRQDGPWEEGTPMAQGARADIRQLVEAVRAGATTVELLDTQPLGLAKYPRFVLTVKLSVRPRRRETPRRVALFVGPPGSGKTRAAHDRLEALEEDGVPFWKLPCGGGSNVWFDGYDAQPNVLFDEFKGRMSKWPLDLLLRVLHEYPEQVPVKGGFTWWNPDMIVLTSNLYPWQWYEYGDRLVSAVERRLTHVFLFEKGREPRNITDTEIWKAPSPTSISNNVVPGFFD